MSDAGMDTERRWPLPPGDWRRESDGSAGAGRALGFAQAGDALRRRRGQTVLRRNAAAAALRVPEGKLPCTLLLSPLPAACCRGRRFRDVRLAAFGLDAF